MINFYKRLCDAVPFLLLLKILTRLHIYSLFDFFLMHFRSTLIITDVKRAHTKKVKYSPVRRPRRRC